MIDPPPPPSARLADHPRDLVAQAAGAELVPWLADWQKRHGLTAVESLYLLHVVCGRTLAALAVAEREHVTRPAPPGGG